MDYRYYILVPIIIGVLTILFAIWLASYVLRRDTGTPAMQKVANAIFKGAMAFLNRQYRTIAILAVFAAIIVGIVLALLGQGSEAARFSLAWHTSVAFLIGSLCSGLSGYIGMYIAVKSNSRTASAATRSLGEALMVSLRGGAVSGFLVVALSLLGVSLVFTAYGGLTDTTLAPSLIVGFGFGASFVALFAQLGGGIYTKAADVGADLVGKVEANIPEDDPRNPAVIADLVGDNVGDCAGRGADLFESTAAENIGAMILGVALYVATKNIGWILFPLVVRAFGLIASGIGLMWIRPSIVVEPDKAAGRDPGEIAMKQLNIGYFITCILCVIGMFGASYLLLHGARVEGNAGIPPWVWFGLAGVAGIALSVAFVYITQYYTAGTWRPVREIAAATLTGPATTIITGTAVAFECVALPILAICVALGLSFWLGSQVQFPSLAITAGVINVGGIFGTAAATMGMLMSCAYVLAMDTFGPITDNAGGITEMGGQAESVRDITDALDGVGNTTKALTKGYGVASAALAAFLLFSAYLDVLYSYKCQEITHGGACTTAAQVTQAGAVYSVNLTHMVVFIAATIGITLMFFFSALAIRAVGTAAKRMIEEVRRQFRDNPKIMAENPADRVDPDYARCVDISTAGALKAMVLPGLVAVLTPIAVGVILGPEAEAGLLMVGTMGGVVLALFLNNGGGAWDNAKKYIEAGYLRVDENGEMVGPLDPNGTVLGKKSEPHKASVVGDTVGDPFKDTAGPSLHIVIKLLSTITLVLAPLYIFLPPQRFLYHDTKEASLKIFAHQQLTRYSVYSLLLAIALSLLLVGCDVSVSLPNTSSGNNSGSCQGNCTLGTGAQGIQVFVEPDAGESPVVDAIESAKKSVWMEMYILSDSKVIYALEDAANHGVDVRIMLEPHPFGASPPTRTMDELRAAGAKVEDSDPSYTLTHEKSMVIDGTTAFITTSNFSRAGLGGYSSSSSYNDRDYGIIDTNSQDVQTVAAIFQADWNRSSVQINDPNLVVSPINSRNDLTSLLNSAKSSILIESEEMNDSNIEQLLTIAAHRGVKVEVILPSGSSNDTGISAIKPDGVQVREDTQLYMHAKLIIIDGQKVFVGSENFSAQSLDQNRELGIIIADQSALQTLQQTFQHDWEVSQAA